MFNSYASRFGTLLLLTASLGNTETVTVRSGNGNVGARDSAVTFLLGPADTDFSHPFTSTDFSSAQSGPAAFILNPVFWVSGLREDPSARWIGTNADANSYQGNTALYSVRFTIATAFSSAALTLHWAADDGLGTINQGLYLNGTAICGNLIDTQNQFAQEHTFTCNDIGPLLHVGTNWLYFDGVNALGPAGLLFSATITTTPTPNPQSVLATVRSGNGSVGGRDSAVIFLQGPANTDFNHAFTSADFSSAQSGPAAFILSEPWAGWISSLSEDPLAHWIGTNANTYSPSGNGTTALYAVSFEIPSGFSSPTLTLHYAVDDNLGGISAGGVNAGVYLNGASVCVNLVPVGNYAIEQTITCNDVSQALTVGENWLYIDAVNLGGAAGLLFSASIAATPTPNPQPSITSLTPAFAVAGSGPLTLTINGSGFITSSSVALGGASHPASLVNTGQLTITLTASDLATAGSFPVVVTNPSPGGGTSNTASFTLTTTLPTIMAVVNAASYVRSSVVSPGEIVTIFGTNIGPATPAGLALDPSTGKVATLIGGVQALFNGIPAPMVYASSTQVSAVVPYETAGITTPPVWIKYAGQTSNAFQLASVTTAPGLFTQNSSGSGPGSILNQDNNVNGPGNPAAKGSIVQVFMTGEGQTSPQGVTGALTTAALPPPQVTPAPLLAIGVTINGQPALYTYAGEAPGLVAGVMQLNVQIPANAQSGNLPITVSIGGNTSQSNVTVSVR